MGKLPLLNNLISSNNNIQKFTNHKRIKNIQTKNDNDVKLKKKNPKLTPSNQLTDREIQNERSLNDSHQRITKEAKELTEKYKGTRNGHKLYDSQKPYSY